MREAQNTKPKRCVGRWLKAKRDLRWDAKQRRLLKLWGRAFGKCAICGEMVPHPIDEVEKLTQHNKPSADHIQPRSLGGSNCLDNLRLTHAWCNSKRGNGLDR